MTQPPIKIVRSFITGSHAYGTPHKGSDVDLVVLVSERDLVKLALLCDSEPDKERAAHYVMSGGTPLRFGNLNLICCADEQHFHAWRVGTRDLIERAPVTREVAIAHMAAVRKRLGLQNLPRNNPSFPFDLLRHHKPRRTTPGDADYTIPF